MKKLMIQLVKNSAKWFWEALFPSRCLVCQKLGEFLCVEHSKFKKCDSSFLKLKSITKTYSVADYKCKKSKLVMEKFKFLGISDLAKILADEIINSHQSVLENSTIIPIPIHWTRKLFRGFNQSELLANQICEKISSTKICNNLKKVKRSKQQAKLNKKEREKNVQNIFAWQGKKINGKIFLLDDVITTGSTLTEAGKTLQKNGMNQVFAITFAKS